MLTQDFWDKPDDRANTPFCVDFRGVKDQQDFEHLFQNLLCILASSIIIFFFHFFLTLTRVMPFMFTCVQLNLTLCAWKQESVSARTDDGNLGTVQDDNQNSRGLDMSEDGPLSELRESLQSGRRLACQYLRDSLSQQDRNFPVSLLLHRT